MLISVIGGTGHIGKFLVPLLVENGNEVTVLTSGHSPVPRGKAWDSVKFETGYYKRNNKAWFNFISQKKTDVLIDILGVDLPATYQAVKKNIRHIIVCGSIWMLGIPEIVPVPEVTQGPCESEGYRVRYKELLSIKEIAKNDGIIFTAVLPPNICGPGKIPLECKGGRDIEVHKAHKKGKLVQLPEGCNTLIGPCDAYDIARGFLLSVQKPESAADEIFNVGSAYSLTVTRFVEVYGEIYKVKIPIEWVQWEKFINKIVPNRGANYHFRAHMSPNITKIQKKLGYFPKYTPEESMERAVAWMYENLPNFE